MKCPGQDMQYWNEEAIFEVQCPQCDTMVEFYKDDPMRRCYSCGHRFVNPKMDFGCATYCQFAEQCLGTLPEEFVMQQENLLKDKVAVEMKRYFKSDFKRISFSTKVARYAEIIAKETKQVNIATVLCAAYLYIIGYPAVSQKKGEVSEADLHREGPAIASAIMEKLGANKELINSVVSIIGNSKPVPSACLTELNIVRDAYRIALLEEQNKNKTLDKGEIEKHLPLFNSEKAREEVLSLFTDLRV